MFSYIRYRVNSADVAEELTSTVFLKALERLPSFDSSRGEMVHWIFRIARNVVTDHFRAERRWSLVPIDWLVERGSPDATPERRVADSEAYGRFTDGLNQLRYRDRDVIGMKFGAGLPNRDIARLTGLTEGQRFSDFILEWTTHYAEAYGLTSNSLGAMLSVVSEAFGQRTLENLAGAPTEIERWLNAQQRERGWSNNTWNRYYELLNTLFNRALKWKTNGVSRIAMNPMTSIEKRTATKRKFEIRIEESIEQKLIDACDLLNRPQHRPHSKRLTWEAVQEIRDRAAAGHKQTALAAEFKISTSLCCQIVKGEIWNPEKYRTGTKGDEMRRRLYAAFDLGLRHGEIVRIQLKHIDFMPITVRVDGELREVLAIALPPSITKGGKTTGETEHVYAGTERLKQELSKRRLALRRDPEAYVFGTEEGRAVKGFKRIWRELFRLAGLDYGRSKGLTWHTIRHEFVLRNIENTGDPVVTQKLARHKDNRTTQSYMHARESRVLAAAVRLDRR